MEHQHKDQVQNDIQHAGQHQKIQRPCGISHGAQHGRSHIIDEQTGEARKIDVQVLRRLRKYVLRGGHQPEHGHNAHIADHGERHTHDKRCGNGGLHRLMELLHILGAKVDADDHAGAYGKAIEKEHQHIDNHGRRAHRRQGLGADKLSHNHGIHRIIKHLEHIAQHQRQGKQQYLLDDIALGHISCRRFSLFHTVPSFQK